MAAALSAVRRLQKDLQEVKENPLLNVVGEPLEANLFEWHVNVRTCEGGPDELEDTSANPLADVSFHLILVFPKSFPTSGPAVYLCTPLPHPNVVLESEQQVQLQIAGNSNQQNADRRLNLWTLSLWECIPAYKGWSSAYSVQSVLLQLQTFLLREDLLYDVRKVPLETAAKRAREYSCDKCGHCPRKPFPGFLTPAEVAHIVRNRQKKLVSTPAGLMLKMKPGEVESENQGIQAGSASSVEIEEVRQQVQPKSASVSTIVQPQTPDAEIAPPEEGWLIVGKKGRAKKQAPPAKVQQVSKGNPISQVKTAALPKTQVQAQAPKVIQPAVQRAEPSGWTAAVKKQSAKQKQISIPKQTAPKQVVNAQGSESSNLPFTTIGAMSVKSGAAAPMDEAMGYFGLLPQEPIITILCLLPKDALSSLSLTCRGLKSACEDGYVWKSLMNRNFPATSIGAASIDDWKHAYMLEQSNILGSLRCFHTRCTHEEDVLGFPISFTTNPRTKDVEYIAVHLDIISETAYREGVRVTADNEPFTHLLPLYITEEHFQRALTRITKTAAELSPLLNEGYHKVFKPEMVLDFMPKALNTMVVLLCDKGIQASERAIEGYCMLHRLFLALCERYNLWAKAERSIVDFIKRPQERVKSACPDLGRMMARLSICRTEGTSWNNLVRPLTGESFDRNVLWICKSNPALVTNYKRAGSGKSVDDELLLAAWEGTRVARRLCLFHAAFLNMVARPPKVPLERVTAGYDILYGMPSAFLKKRLRTHIESILESKYDWPFFFRVMGVQCPSKEYLTGWFGQCWKNSLDKGYHSRQTKFENIQKSGVSKILLKGESYTAPPNLATAQMFETWRYQDSLVEYLDASCLLYDFDGKYLETIDYRNLLSKDGAITHSGDVIDVATQTGTHIITINMKQLEKNVHELYFTMSAYAGATLQRFRLPFVQLKDMTTEMELCKYTLEDKDLGSHVSVIMCRMYRATPGATKWEVQAMGTLGAGSADNYEPLLSRIQEIIWSRRGPRVLVRRV